MAVSFTATPNTPPSLYRAVRYTANALLPTPVAVTFIRLAEASDVSAYPSLQLGVDIICEHAAIAETYGVGQHMILADCDEWSGVRKVREVLDSTHVVLDGPSYVGAFTDTGGTIAVYRNNHRFNVWLWMFDFDAEPLATLRITPVNGQATFDIKDVLRSWIGSSKIHNVINANLGASGFTSTEGLSSIIYRIAIGEAYDIPDDDGVNVFTEVDKWPGADYGTTLCAVNGVLPYDHDYADDPTSALDWAQNSFALYRPTVYTDPTAYRFLTYAPRGHGAPSKPQGFYPAEKGRLVVLNSSVSGYASSSKWWIRVEVIDTSTGTEFVYGAQARAFTVPANVSSFAIPTGPAELAAFFSTWPTFLDFDKYTVQLWYDLSNNAQSPATEKFTFVKLHDCKEVRRRFWWINKLGGLDSYTFTGRESASVKASRRTVARPYSTEIAHSFRERMQRVDPERHFSASTGIIDAQARRWLVEDLFESATVVTDHGGAVYRSPVIFTEDSADAHTTQERPSTLTLKYRIGVDNLSQAG